MLANVLVLAAVLGMGPPLRHMDPVSIPFSLVRDSLIVIPVCLNGHGPYKFLLDTGATKTILQRVTAEKLNLPNGTRQKIFTAGGFVPVELRPIEVLQIGSIYVSRTFVAVTDSSLLSELKVDGLLGADYLKQFTVSIDYKHKLLNIAN